MNKTWILIVSALFFYMPKSCAQHDSSTGFTLELGAVKTYAEKEHQQQLSEKNVAVSKSNYAHVVFNSDLKGAIWVDGKKYLLEANAASQQISVAQAFSYYFVTEDSQFATQDKSRKIRPNEIEKTSTLVLDINPKAKFEAFIKQASEHQQSKQIIDAINHQFVEISDGVSMQSHEVTIHQYAQFIKETIAFKEKQTTDASLIIKYTNSKSGIRSIEEYVDWKFNPTGNLIDLQDENALTHPVVNVSWYEAKAFCDWLSNKDSTFYYRLPYVSEWESVADWNEEIPIVDQANFADISLQKKIPNKKVHQEINDQFAYTMPAGRLQKNKNGFYDMLGNVAEWMEDDSKISGQHRKIHKGGSYFTLYQDGLIKNRQHSYFSAQRHCGIGFRICREYKKRL